MQKGRIRHKLQCFTIMLVPHSSQGIKSVRLTIIPVSAALCAILALVVVFVFHTVENNNLKQQINIVNEMQQRLAGELSLKQSEISDLKSEIDQNNFTMDEMNKSLSELDALALYVRTFAESNTPLGSDAAVSREASETSRGDDIRSSRNVASTSLLDDFLSKSAQLKKQYAQLAASTEEVAAYLAAKPDYWPSESSRVTSAFGYRKDPVTVKRQFHHGLDIGATYGSPVAASGKGSVTYADFYGSYGRVVIIDHGYGLTTLYGHMSKILVKKGAFVEKGQEIGKIGSSGKSTGSHLHFEIGNNGVAIDPLTFIGGISNNK